MRWLSSAICTSGEPVSPSVVAYSAMIFFLVSASVPIDMRAPSGSRCAARRGLFTRALWIRGRCTADTGNCKAISAGAALPRIGAARTAAGPASSADADALDMGAQPGDQPHRACCNLCEAICGLGDLTRSRTPTDGARVTGVRGNPGGPAVARPHLPQGGRASPTSTTDPDRLRRPRAPGRAMGRRASELGARSAGTRRSTWSPTASPRTVNEHGRDARRRLPRQPQRPQPRLDDPRRRRW